MVQGNLVLQVDQAVPDYIASKVVSNAIVSEDNLLYTDPVSTDELWSHDDNINMSRQDDGSLRFVITKTGNSGSIRLMVPLKYISINKSLSDRSYMYKMQVRGNLPTKTFLHNNKSTYSMQPSSSYWTTYGIITSSIDTDNDNEISINYNARNLGDELIIDSITLHAVQMTDEGLPTSSYLHIKYSNDGGKSFTHDAGREPGDWMGQYVDSYPNDSVLPSRYTWSKIRGSSGNDGRTTYFWVRYSKYADGAEMTTDPSGTRYVGTATTINIPTAPTDPRMYVWQLVTGEGIPGEAGDDGRTTYLHIRYSDDGGKTFTSNNGEDIGDWMGQYSDFEPQDSIYPEDYKWSKIKGEDIYNVDIISSKGSIFKNGIIDTKLYAIVYRGSQNITNDIDSNRFKWSKVDSDGVPDDEWNQRHAGGTKSVSINGSDIRHKAVFSCDIEEA